MIYTYYNKAVQKGATATNLKAIARVSNIQYLDLLDLFKNGQDVYDTEEYIILKTELIKGRQGIVKQSSEDKPPPIEQTQVESDSDEFDKLMKS